MKQQTVFVGISGGVDSSVAALLLQQEGFRVVGAFIKTWQPDFIECTWKQERRDAMRVCAKLGIPFLEIDAVQEYKEKVGEYMIEEYKKGRTPNPDVMCNKEVKFGVFLRKALDMGADFVATGHYAQKLSANIFGKGLDPKKDQSYFLWTLSAEQLEKVLFPIGALPKQEVRKIAEKHGLFTATKKDSQGVCFLGEIDMKEFLGHYIDQKEGDVLNTDGQVVGRHDGAVFYTIGERHGFTITEKGTSDAALYVIAKDLEKNTITVAADVAARSEHIDTKKLYLENTVWNTQPEQGGEYSAKIRYGQADQACEYGKDEQGEYVLFDQSQDSFSAGQSVVVYNGMQCLGGGVVM
jgi:tRNA-specific 2-thiouridylase